MTLLLNLPLPSDNWVHHQSVVDHLDLLSWDEDEVKANPTQQVFSLDDCGQGSYLRTNQTKQICGLITYMKHVFSEYMAGGVWEKPFPPFSSEEWSKQTSTMMRLYLVENLPTPIGPQPVISWPVPSSEPAAYSPAALELMSFKKGIKREITSYPSLKDEKYFDGFKRSLFIVPKTHECSEVLDPNYTPGSEPEEEELFEAKQTFICLVSSTPTSKLTWGRPSLKDEKYFDGFKRSLFIVAKTHECSEVLDPNYTPGSEPEEEELFEAKQTFICLVSSTPTSKLTWGRPLSGGIWLPLMLKVYGKSLVST